MILAELVWCACCRRWRRWAPRVIQHGKCSDCRIPKGLGCCGDCEAFPCECPDRWLPDYDGWLLGLADLDPVIQVIDLPRAADRPTADWLYVWRRPTHWRHRTQAKRVGSA